MPALKLFTDVQARVVAWHNRHPLARRIQASQVHSIGEVALPFAAETAPAAQGHSAHTSALPSGSELLAGPAAALVDTASAAQAGAGPGLAQDEAADSDAPAGTAHGQRPDDTPQPAPNAEQDPPTADPATAAKATADADEDPWPDGPGASTAHSPADLADASASPSGDPDLDAAPPDDSTQNAEAAEHTPDLDPPSPAPGAPDAEAAPAEGLAPGALTDGAAAAADADLDALIGALADPAETAGVADVADAAEAAEAAPVDPAPAAAGGGADAVAVAVAVAVAEAEAEAAAAAGPADQDDLPEFVVDEVAEPARDDQAPAEATPTASPSAAASAPGADADADADAAEPTADSPAQALSEPDTRASTAAEAPAEPTPSPTGVADVADPGPITAIDVDTTAAVDPTHLAGDAIALPNPSQETAPEHTQAPPSLADRLQAARAAASSGESDAPPDAGSGGIAPAAQASAALATAPAAALPSFARASPPWWRHWWARLAALARWRPKARQPAGSASAAATDVAASGAPQTRLGPLTALFSGKFLWPISPARVARWARRHGSLQALAPPDWPVRQVAPEPDLQQKARKAGRPATTTVHLFTAAIGVDDRRMRVLVSADGRVLGPRAYDRKRVAAAGLAMVLALGGLGWRLKPAALPGLPPAEESAEMASAASAPHAEDIDTASTGPNAASAAGGHGDPAPQAVADAASTPADQGHGSVAQAHLTEHEPGLGTALPHPGGAGALPAAAHPASAPALDGSAPALVVGAASAAAKPVAKPGELLITRTPPPAFPQRRASGPLAQIRPQLPEDVRLAARAQSEAARNAADKNLPMPVVVPTQRYAVVSQPERDRETAEARLATMLSVRAQLPPPAPLHSDVMPTQGRWRVALWPFANQADATRAQEMLQVRGLRADVVEF